MQFHDASFDNSSNTATINSWSWDFGDGSPGVSCSGSGCTAEQNPTHTYLVPGTYTVTLVTGGTHPGTETKIAFVSVS